MKIKMHTLLNRLTLWLIVPIIAVASVVIFEKAANDTMKIVGIVLMAGLLAFSVWLFLAKYCIFDYAVFSDEGIELRSPFKKKAFYKYNEVIACAACYTSVAQCKDYLSFTDKSYNAVVREIDTSKGGNLIAVNKLKVVYVPATKEIVEFLNQKFDLQWYGNN